MLMNPRKRGNHDLHRDLSESLRHTPALQRRSDYRPQRVCLGTGGKEEVFYEVSIRLDAVEDMARKAAGNAAQVSRAGPLRVRVLKRVAVAPDDDKAAEPAYNAASR
jgi:hypothetical protein